jgi:predicted nucleotide-binding protein
VHGHDHKAVQQLSALLEKLKCRPIIIKQEADVGLKSILEKFIERAESSDFAIALLTPDDKQARMLPEPERFRARQNVILEIGWLMAKLGRLDVVLLHRGEVELPSDLMGILFLQFKKNVAEVSGKLEEILIRRGIVKPAAFR